MQNKKTVLVLGVLVLVVGAAAFLGGMLLNQRLDPGMPLSEEELMSIVVPAPELPITLPEVTGQFIERHDNTIIVETKSLETGGMVTVDTKRQSGPRVEVVVTSGTIIYRETTQPSEPLSAENRTIQQTVEQATLDDLDSQSMIMAWGRKSGDRMIAEVLLYSHTAAVKRAIFEDCEICP